MTNRDFRRLLGAMPPDPDIPQPRDDDHIDAMRYALFALPQMRFAWCRPSLWERFCLMFVRQTRQHTETWQWMGVDRSLTTYTKRWRGKVFIVKEKIT